MLGLLTRNILIATTFHPCLQGRKSTTPEFGQTLTEVAFVGYHFCKVWMPRPGVRVAFLNMLGSVESRRMVNGRTYICVYMIQPPLVPPPPPPQRGDTSHICSHV